MVPFRFRQYFICFLFLFLIAVPTSLFAQPISLSLTLKESPSLHIGGLDTLGSAYLSANDFAKVLGFPFAINDNVRKIEFRLPSYRVKFSARNPFVVITDVGSNSSSVYQFPRQCILRNGTYFVPAAEFLHLLSSLWTEKLTLHRISGSLTVQPSSSASPFDITGLEIEQKANGYLLTIKTSRKIELRNVESLLKQDGWLFVTVAHARADTIALSKIKPTGAVRQILTFQSPTSVQLTFRVSTDIIKAEVLSTPNSNDLLVALHSKSSVFRSESERKNQGTITESLEKDRDRWKMDVIVIDPGHGGKDPGTIGVGGTREKDITLKVAKKLGKLIEKNMKDVKVVFTRTTDTFVELYKRTQIANEANGKLFVSLHCNSTPTKPSAANGFEIYLLRPGRTESAIAIAERENSVIRLEEGYQDRYMELTEENFILVTLQQLSFMRHSERFAEVVSETMSSKLNIRNSGVKQAGFYVLVGASMPNALVELGYLSNRDEEKVLRSDAGQTRIAEALFEGIKRYKALYEKGIHDFETTEQRQ